MRKLLLLSAVVIMGTCHAWAQDDMYFTPSKKDKEAAKAQYEKARETYYCGSERDVDEYNRRTRRTVPGSYITQIGDSASSMQVITSDSVGSDVIDFTAGTGVYPDSLSAAARSKYNDTYGEDDDYLYSRRMERFDDGRPVVLNVYVNDPWYIDPWYDPWFHDSWYYSSWYRWGWYGNRWYAGWGWYDPWYYDPWFYGPRYHHTVFVPTHAYHNRGIDRGRPALRAERSGSFGRNASRGYPANGNRRYSDGTASRSNTYGRGTYSGSGSSSYGGHSTGGFGGSTSRSSGGFSGGSRSGGGFSGGGGHSGGGARGGRR